MELATNLMQAMAVRAGYAVHSIRDTSSDEVRCTTIECRRRLHVRAIDVALIKGEAHVYVDPSQAH